MDWHSKTDTEGSTGIALKVRLWLVNGNQQVQSACTGLMEGTKLATHLTAYLSSPQALMLPTGLCQDDQAQWSLVVLDPTHLQ